MQKIHAIKCEVYSSCTASICHTTNIVYTKVISEVFASGSISLPILISPDVFCIFRVYACLRAGNPASMRRVHLELIGFRVTTLQRHRRSVFNDCVLTVMNKISKIPAKSIFIFSPLYTLCIPRTALSILS